MKKTAVAILVAFLLSTSSAAPRPDKRKKILCAMLIQNLSDMVDRTIAWAAPQVFRTSEGVELAHFLERHADQTQLASGQAVALDSPVLQEVDPKTREILQRLVATGGVVETGDRDFFRVKKDGTAVICFSDVEVLPHEADHFEIWEQWVAALEPTLGREGAGVIAYAAMSTPMGNLYVEASALQAQLEIDKNKTPSLDLVDDLLTAQPYMFLSAIGKGFRLRAALEPKAPLQRSLQAEQRQIGERLLKEHTKLHELVAQHLAEALAGYSPEMLTAMRVELTQKLTPELLEELTLDDIAFPLNFSLLAPFEGTPNSRLLKLVSLMSIERQGQIHSFLVELLSQ